MTHPRGAFADPKDGGDLGQLQAFIVAHDQNFSVLWFQLIDRFVHRAANFTTGEIVAGRGPAVDKYAADAFGRLVGQVAGDNRSVSSAGLAKLIAG
jgi:hypothetical protein